MASSEVIAAIKNHVCASAQFHGKFPVQAARMRFNHRVRINCRNMCASRIDLILPNIVGGVNNLAMQITQFHHVIVDNCDVANSRSCEILQRR